METLDLSGAYALNSPEDCRRLYAQWADTYDTDFAQSMAYRLPAEVAAAFLRAHPKQGNGQSPGDVLDIGAGTGLLAAALRGFGFDGAIDGVDLSAPMLAQAARKGVYRTLIEADITKPLPGGHRYTGLVSSGTFTHGHVGPEALAGLLHCAHPGALVVLSVNQAVWDRNGYDAAFASLRSRITDMTCAAVQIYGDSATQTDPTHAKDRALIVRFRTR
jgi:predicted TPR repeat methyltransferase